MVTLTWPIAAGPSTRRLYAVAKMPISRTMPLTAVMARKLVAMVR